MFGLLAVTRAILPHMRKARSGRILNISSIGGYRGSAGFGVYGATKFAVEALSEAMRAELKPLGIHVTAIEPGYFRTDFMDASSLKVSRIVIPDYSATAGRVRANAGTPPWVCSTVHGARFIAGPSGQGGASTVHGARYTVIRQGTHGARWTVGRSDVSR